MAKLVDLPMFFAEVFVLTGDVAEMGMYGWLTAFTESRILRIFPLF